VSEDECRNGRPQTETATRSRMRFYGEDQPEEEIRSALLETMRGGNCEVRRLEMKAKGLL
jgi:hypothetical protein